MNIVHTYILNKLIEDNIIKSNKFISYYFSSCIDLYLYESLISLFLEFKSNTLYFLNVCSEFNSYLFVQFMIEHLYSTYKLHNKTEYKEIENIIKLKEINRVIVITYSVKFFVKFLTNTEFFNEVKAKLKARNLNIVLFCKKDSYSIINKLNKIKNIERNFIFKDCFEKFIPRIVANKNIRGFSTEISQLLYLKLRYSSDINCNYILKICKNIYKNKLKFKLYEKFDIEKQLKSKLFSQNEAIESVTTYSSIINLSKTNRKKPLGSWLLCGPSGSGKTEIAKVLSYSLFESHNNLIKLDMSEYMEEHSVSRLIGAPTGYAGCYDETILSKNLKNDSYSVILFDEIEKAHKSICDLMLQVLDNGKLISANGSTLDFSKSFIIFTSNIGYSKKSLNTEGIVEKNFVLSEIEKFFRPEFLSRLTKIIIFNSLIGYKNVHNICDKFLKIFNDEFQFNINLNEKNKNNLIDYSSEFLYGARVLKRVIESIFYKFYLINNHIIKYNRNYTLNCEGSDKIIKCNLSFNPVCV